MKWLLSFILFYLGLTYNSYFIVKIILFLFIAIKYVISQKKLKSILYLGFFILGILLNILLRQNLFYSNLGIVVSSKENYYIFQTLSGRYYVYDKVNKVETFDILILKGQVKDYSFTTYESQLDFNKYLENNLVFKSLEVESKKVILNNPIRIKSFISYLLSKYSEKERDILSLLVFSSSSSSYSSLVYNNNLNYYLALSSFHIYLVNEFFKKILGIKLKDQRVEQVLLLIDTLFFVLSNYKTSILRLILFKLTYYYSTYHKKIYSSRLEQIGLVFLILGTIRVNSLTDSSFIMVFCLYFYIYYIKEAKNEFSLAKQKIIFPLFINLFLFPLLLINNHKFSLFPMVFSLLFSPLIIINFILFFLGIILPLTKIQSFFINSLYNIVYYFSKINLTIYSSRGIYIFVIVYYIVLFIIIYLIKTGRKNKTFGFNIALITMILSLNIPFENFYLREVDFINVGQGDSILIRNKNKSYLIDTGGVIYNDLAINSLIPFFKKEHINKIDEVILTHDDFDHTGALSSLVNNFKVDKIVTNSTFEEINYDNFSLKNLNVYSDIWEEDNDTSLVLYLEFKNYHFLFMGDATKKIEEKIMKDNKDLVVDYLKVGHHGSNTSSSEEFIKFYHPKEAIISVGKNNKYNHPSSQVIDTLKKYQIKIRRTDEEGTIKYHIW